MSERKIEVRYGAVWALAASAWLWQSVALAAMSRSDTEDAAIANLSLGVAYLRQNNLLVAKDKLERARTQSPREPLVHSALGLLYEQMNDDKSAAASFRIAQRLAPGNPEILNNYAAYLCRRGQVDEGVKRFEAAATNRVYTTPWAAITNAGVCLNGAKRTTEAEQQFLRALAVNPLYGEAVLQLGELEISTQRPAAAWQRVAVYLRSEEATAEMLYLGWRAAKGANDAGNAAAMAAKLALDFPASAESKQVQSSSRPMAAAATAKPAG